MALLFVLAGLVGCSGDAQQAERNIGQLQLGDTDVRARELLGEPAYTVEACESVTFPGKRRDRAAGRCGRTWVYGSIFDRKIEVLIDADGRVGLFMVYGSQSAGALQAHSSAEEGPAP